MDTNSPRSWIAVRIAAVLIVAIVAIVMASASWVIGLVAAVTVAAVMIDLLAFSARTPSVVPPGDLGDEPPARITVDLSRRR